VPRLRKPKLIRRTSMSWTLKELRKLKFSKRKLRSTRKPLPSSLRPEESSLITLRVVHSSRWARSVPMPKSPPRVPL
jgi:hypothetical protein